MDSNSSDAGPSQSTMHLGPAARKLLADGQKVPLPSFSLSDLLDKSRLYDPVTGYPLPPAPNDDGSPSIDPPLKPESVDPDHVPRPENKFILFRRDILARIASLRLPKSQQSAFSSAISDNWKSAPQEVREHYSHLSALSKQVHNQRYPGYKYQPRSQQKIKEDKVRNRERHEEQRRKIRDEKRVKRVDDSDPTPPGKVPIPRKFSSTRSSTGKYEPPRGGKRISKEYAPFRQTSGQGTPNGGQQDRQTSFKYYPKSAFGPDGVQEESDSDSDSDSLPKSKSDSSKGASTPQAQGPTFEAHVPMYQPPPFLPIITSHAPSPSSASPSALTLPPLPSAQTQTQTQPQAYENSLWPSLEQGVTWSAGAPIIYADQPWSQLQPQPQPQQEGYASWKQGPEPRISLNVQAPLETLHISQEEQAQGQGLNVTFATDFLCGGTHGGNENTFWGDFVAASMARGDMPSGDANPTIQGLSVQDYAHYTGSSGAGAIASDPVNFFHALGVDVDVRNNDWEELGKMVAREGWGQDPSNHAQPQAEEFSFGRFVSFGSSTKDVEVEQGSASEPSPPQELVTPIQHEGFEPFVSIVNEEDGSAPPPPYVPPSGASKFPTRRVAGHWHPLPQSRNVSDASMRSIIIHDEEDSEQEHTQSRRTSHTRHTLTPRTPLLDFNFTGSDLGMGMGGPPPIPVASRPGSASRNTSSTFSKRGASGGRRVLATSSTS